MSRTHGLAFGTMLLAVALVASIGSPLPSQGPAVPPRATAHPTPLVSSDSTLQRDAGTAAYPSTVIGPIQGKYFLGNTSLPFGPAAAATSVVVNPVTQTFYTANYGAGTITAASESDGRVLRSAIVGSFFSGFYPTSLVAVPASNAVYVGMVAPTTGFILVLDGTTLGVRANLSMSGAPTGIFEPAYDSGAYDPSSNQVFFTNYSNGILLAIHVATNRATYVLCPAIGCIGAPIAVAAPLGELVATTYGPNLVIYNTTTDTSVAMVAAPPGAKTFGIAYLPGPQVLVAGNVSGSNSGVFFEWNLSSRAYLGTLPHDPAYVVDVVFDTAHQDIVATGENGSLRIVAVNQGTGAVDGFYQAGPGSGSFFSLALDPPANVVLACGLTNNSSIAFNLPALTPVVRYASFPYHQVGVAVDPTTGTVFTLGLFPHSIRASSEVSGTTLWTDYLSRGYFNEISNEAVVDPSTGTLYVAIAGVGLVGVFNETTGAMVGQIALPATVNATTIAVDPAAQQLYVGQTNGSVSIWSTSTRTLLANVPTPGFVPCAAAASTSRHEAYFTDCAPIGHVTTIKGPALARGSTYTTGSDPSGITLDPSGIIYTADLGAGTVTRINTSSGTVLPPLALGGYLPRDIAIDARDGILALTSLQAETIELVDPQNGTHLGFLIVHTSSWAITFDSASTVFIAPLYTPGQTFELRELTAPAAPTSLTATAGNGTIQAQWSAPPTIGVAISNYTVALATAAAGPWGSPHDVTATNYTYTGLTDGTRYFVTVTATTVVGTSPHSAVANATPLGVPFPPTAVLAIGVSSTSINVTWAPPATTEGAPVGFYSLKWAVAGSLAWTTIREGAVLATLITGLSPSTNYTVIVIASNSVGASNPSTQSTAATQPSPAVHHPPASSAFTSSSNLLLYLIVGIAIAAVALAFVKMRGKKAVQRSGDSDTGPMVPPPAHGSGRTPPPGAL
ncbi:MAG: fibronectin type III domain-containing protein [Thermoplasmata archaeon]|nr:fibronectin type III domain-containing protein [Thermoplasmata archaeon]